MYYAPPQEYSTHIVALIIVITGRWGATLRPSLGDFSELIPILVTIRYGLRIRDSFRALES